VTISQLTKLLTSLLKKELRRLEELKICESEKLNLTYLDREEVATHKKL